MNHNRFVIVDKEINVGCLIRHTDATPGFINVVHKITRGNVPGELRIYSTRIFHVSGGKVTLLKGTRARPFSHFPEGRWHSWHVVKRVKEIDVDTEDDVLAALARGFELYQPHGGDTDHKP